MFRDLRTSVGNNDRCSLRFLLQRFLNMSPRQYTWLSLQTLGKVFFMIKTVFHFSLLFIIGLLSVAGCGNDDGR